MLSALWDNGAKGRFQLLYISKDGVPERPVAVRCAGGHSIPGLSTTTTNPMMHAVDLYMTMPGLFHITTMDCIGPILEGGLKPGAMLQTNLGGKQEVHAWCIHPADIPRGRDTVLGDAVRNKHSVCIIQIEELAWNQFTKQVDSAICVTWNIIAPYHIMNIVRVVDQGAGRGFKYEPVFSCHLVGDHTEAQFHADPPGEHASQATLDQLRTRVTLPESATLKDVKQACLDLPEKPGESAFQDLPCRRCRGCLAFQPCGLLMCLWCQTVAANPVERSSILFIGGSKGG